MSYSESRAARKYLRKIKSQGKEPALIHPHHESVLRILLKALTILSFLIAIPALFVDTKIAWILILTGLIFFGLMDYFVQDDHAIIRNYGPFGRARYIVESLMRDKYLQYFNETNTDGRPIPKIVRDYIYQKAHGLKSLSAFGTELDNDDETDNTARSRLLHRNFRVEQLPSYNFAVEVGTRHEHIRSYTVTNSVNISAMSYGSLNYRACESLSIGAKGVCYVNTGEGGYGPHGIARNDVIFQVGTGEIRRGRYSPTA